jgi:hypothetical protein
MTKLSLKPAGAGSDPSADPRWTLHEAHHDERGALLHANVVSFGSLAELEAELARLDLSNLERQRLLDGETVTLWSG